MSIQLDFDEPGLSAHAHGRLVRHLEEIRTAVVDLLGLDEALRRRRIVFYSNRLATSQASEHHHAADELMQDMPADEVGTTAAAGPSFSLHQGDLEVRLPRLMRNPALMERLMVGQLLHVGLRIPPAMSIRFVLDGVLGIVQSQVHKRPRHSRLDLPLMTFLAERGIDGQPRLLQPFLSGRCAPDERRMYLAIVTSFVSFILKQYDSRRLGIFASNLKPQAPDEASRAAFRKPFHAMQAEWEAWAHTTQGRPLSVPGFVVKGLALYSSKRRQASAALAAMVPQLAYTLMMPVGLSILFDKGILKNDAAVITHTLTWLSVGYVISAIGGLVQDYCSSIAAARSIADLREKMFLKTQRLADGILQQTESGQLTSTFSSDMILIETAVTRVLPNLVFRVILLLGSVAIAFSMEWHMALASVVCLPIAFIAPRPLAKIASVASYERKSEDASLAALVQEDVVLSRTIRMFHLQRKRLDAFKDVLRRLAGKTERANVYSALAGRFTTIGASFVQLFVIGMGAVLSIDGELSAGVVIAFIGLLLNMGGAIAVLADAIPLLIQSVGAWQRIDMLLDAQESQEAEVGLTPGRWSGVDSSIEFKNVFFNFPGGDPILDGVSFQLSMGQSVAFVGPSGSGKSTILNLIQRHVDCTDGEVLMDGTPMTAIAGEDLRRRMATVAQDNPLFNISVRENIRMGRFDATDEEITAVAKAAEIHEGIVRMAQGYDTIVGEGGSHLSGGQRQRVAIARALLRNPSVLLLDEATSALDPASQNAINATLKSLRAGRMVLTVTHHLQDVVDMDKIVVLRQGHVVETGSHQELLQRHGFYAQMWDSQNGLSLSDDGKSAAISVERVRALDFFAHLPDETLQAIAATMHSETVDAGQILLREGKRPDRFYILVRGTVDMSVRGLDGRAVGTRRLQAGDFFGEFALLPDARQVDTATATSMCSFLTLRRAPFVRIFGDDRAGLEATENAIASRLEAKLDQLVERQEAGEAMRQPQREAV